MAEQDIAISLGINRHGVVFVDGARITALSTSGRIMFDTAGPGGGLCIKVDDASLRHMRVLIDLHFGEHPFQAVASENAKALADLTVLPRERPVDVRCDAIKAE